jgi:O-antigen ligase
MVRALAWLLVVVPPVLVVPGLHEPFRLPKQVASEVLALALLAALCWTASTQATAKLPAEWVRRVLVALLPLVAVVVVSATLSPHRVLSSQALVGFAAAFGATCGLAAMPRETDRLLRWLAVPAVVLAAGAVAQHLSDISQREGDAARLQLVSLAGNVGDLAAYLVLPALIGQWVLAGRAEKQEARSSRWLWGAALALVIAALALAQTLVPIAALAAGSLVFWCLQPRGRVLHGWAAAVAATLLLAGVLVSPLGTRLATEWRELRMGEVQDVLSGRLDGWRAGLHIGRESPLLGTGPGTYRAEFAGAKLALLDRGVDFYAGHGYASHFDHAHSEPIEVFSDLGVAGLLASAWLMFCLVRAASSKERRGDRALGLALLAAFVVLAAFWFPLRTALVLWPYVVAGAWLFGPSQGLPHGGDESTARSGPPTERVRSPSRLRSVASASILVAAAALWHGYTGCQLLHANRVLSVVEEEVLAMTRDRRLDRGALLRAAAALDLAMRWAPADERFPLAIGSCYLLLGDVERAEPWYRRSLAIAPRAETYLNLGRALLARGDAEGARQSFEMAVRLNGALREEVVEMR